MPRACTYQESIAAPIFCSISGLILFLVAAFACQTFEVGTDRADDPRVLGYWLYEHPDGNCKSHGGDVDFDAPMKTGRAFGIMGAIVGGLICIALFLAAWNSYTGGHMVWYSLGVAQFLMSVFSLVLLAGLRGTDFDLKIGPAGYCVFPSFVFWVAAGVFTVLTVKARESVVPAPTPAATDVQTKPKEEARAGSAEDIEATGADKK